MMIAGSFEAGALARTCDGTGGMITPVLLCGGAGTRLWPLSRGRAPKQFAAITGQRTLFQEAALRLSGAGFADPLVVTADAFRFIASEQLDAVGLAPGAILIEPDGRDTAPAILAAALHAARTDPEAVLLAAPSDHVIADPARLRDTLALALPAARAGRIVTFGIVPDRPETGYGYLELAAPPDGGAEPAPLRGFVEKPDAERAAQMLWDGRYLWNSGMFLFSAKRMIAAFAEHAPALSDPVARALEDARSDLGFTRLDPAHWSEIEPVSVDYAVMEKMRDLCVLPLHGGWSDLGDWDAVWRETQVDGLSLKGEVLARDCTDSLLRADVTGQALVGIGLDGMIAVAMPDAVLVAPRSRAQEVKDAIADLRGRGAAQVEEAARTHRPWGWFESLAAGPRFQVKRITVHPGAALSLQSHHHRSEHWVVVEGTARVTIGDRVSLVSENESVYVPLGSVHRLENPGRLPMVLIEVQTGAYLGEDDIARHADIYARE